MSASCSQTADVRCARAVGAHEGSAPAAGDVIPGTGRPPYPTEEERALVSRLAVRRVYLNAKRAFDFLFSFCVILVLLLPCLVIALLIFIDDPEGSPLFVQRRVGRGGRVFPMFKFRTMYKDAEKHLESLLEHNEKDGPVFKMKNDPRITRVGRILRKTSIDELPQFINVLAGHMSVVGPRPALPAEVTQYSERDRLRLAVKPGITCIWQTSRNRDDISFGQWVDLDIEYLRTCSMRTDIRLIVRTVSVVLTAEGA